MAELVGGQLDAFLAHHGSLPWSPGDAVDCCLALAAWAMWLGHPDPAAHLRGTYEAGQGQLDAIARGGGVVALVEQCALSIGGRPTAKPQRGDIGAVGSPANIRRQFGVIHDGAGWLTRTPKGFERVTARALSAWKI